MRPGTFPEVALQAPSLTGPARAAHGLPRGVCTRTGIVLHTFLSMSTWLLDVTQQAAALHPERTPGWRDALWVVQLVVWA